MSIARYDYGRAGIVGIGTPQANPTVEAEMAILLPPLLPVTTRLTSHAATPAGRLYDYLVQLESTLESFDTMPIRAFGFACTASAYLVDPQQADHIIDRCAARFGYPVITASAAIEGELRALGARRIAIASPYPAELRDAAVAYWEGRGFAVGPVAAAGDLAPGADTRGIYSLGSGDARAALDRLDLRGVDAILLSGTGMPSLPLIADWDGDVPLLSSNLCLAHALTRALGRTPATAADWRTRCAAATNGA